MQNCKLTRIRISIYPADTPRSMMQKSDPPRPIDPETFEEIRKELEQRTPYPRIIFDPLEHAAEQDDVLIQTIGRRCGDPIRVVTLTEFRWTRVDDSLEQMRFIAKAYQADVLIRRQPSGHIIILFPTSHCFPISILRDMLRDEEKRLHRRHGGTRMFDKMVWRMDPSGSTMFNGSFTNPKCPRPSTYEPSRISLDFIREHLRLVLSPLAFDPGRESECLRGNCTSHISDRCSLQAYGLPQCQALIQIRKSVAPRRRVESAA